MEWKNYTSICYLLSLRREILFLKFCTKLNLVRQLIIWYGKSVLWRRTISFSKQRILFINLVHQETAKNERCTSNISNSLNFLRCTYILQTRTVFILLWISYAYKRIISILLNKSFYWIWQTFYLLLYHCMCTLVI